MRIDFLGLEAFVSICDRGGFHRAAAHLNLSQTALSHRMRKLEEDLGVKLLTRTTRQVALTPTGLDLLPKARQIIEDLQNSFDDLRRKGKERQERLAIGCLPTLAVHYLSRILKEFQIGHPDVSLRIHDNSAAEIAALVQSGQAEFGLTIVSASHFDLEIEPLAKEPFVLACPEDHSIARGHPTVSLADLEGVPLVRISPQAGNRALIDDALGARREKMAWRYEVQHVSTALSLVLAGVGLAIVPKLSVDEATPGLVLIGLRNPAITRTLGIVMRRGLPLSPAAAELRAMIERRMRAEV